MEKEIARWRCRPANRSATGMPQPFEIAAIGELLHRID
jgi:hypothetical protein